MNLVARGEGLQALELGWELLPGKETLLRVHCVIRFLVGPPEHNFILLVVVLVEQRFFIVHRTRCNLHLESVLLRVLLDFLEVLVVAVLGKPRDDIASRPVDLEGVLVFIVHVVL